MSSATASRLVLVSFTVAAVMVGTDFFGKGAKPGDGFRAAWALGALYMVLALAADLVPEIGGPFALLVLLGVVFARDQTLYRLFGITSAQGGTR